MSVQPHLQLNFLYTYLQINVLQLPPILPISYYYKNCVFFNLILTAIYNFSFTSLPGLGKAEYHSFFDMISVKMITCTMCFTDVHIYTK